ncbi:uncharacterized protein [Aquarana catesbeiana]|uniref:uncharacterized protein isoform X2 n=1 Tax=Aquarana catesbeiana TaxID=8400 RepID=UPI003CC95C0F
MSNESFDHLLDHLTLDLEHQDTAYHNTLTPTEHLIVTLWFPATVHLYAAMHFQFSLHCLHCSWDLQGNMAQSTESTVVMPAPTVEWWRETAELFWSRCNFL